MKKIQSIKQSKADSKRLPARLAISLLFCFINIPLLGQDYPSAFRVLPYLLSPSADGITINWFTENNEAGTLYIVSGGQTDSLKYQSAPKEMEELTYSDLEESERMNFPDMFRNKNFKHTISVRGLKPDKLYKYFVTQNGERFEAHFRTAPLHKTQNPIRFIAFADSETDLEGRKLHRKWERGSQAGGSTGRPEGREF